MTSLTDVIDDFTNRRVEWTFLYALHWTRTANSLSFRDIWHRKLQTHRESHRQTNTHVDTSTEW